MNTSRQFVGDARRTNMKKAQKAQAKKARKDAERAKRIEEDGETTDTAAQAPRARPAWQLNDDKPTVSVARRQPRN